MSLEQTLSKQLEDRAEINQLRRLKIASSESIDFSSNDYLGIASKDFLSNFHQGHLMNGSGGSRLLSGNKEYHVQLEKSLAHYFKSPSFLLYNSGYVANLGLLSSIPQRDDLIILDEYAHICMKEGARLSRAKHFNFKHNDLLDLENKLKRADARYIFIVVESVYSMDGDQAPLVELVALADKYNAYLIVDEAHTTGLLADDGSGLCNALNLSERIFARIYTFGKAIGAHGAGIAGDQYLIDYLVNYSRSFIYTTALPEHSIHIVAEAIAYRQRHPELWAKLQEKIKLFKSSIDTGIPLLNSQHPIQGILTGDSNKAIKLAEYLLNKGMDARPIVSPTVPKDKARIRICLHVFNTDTEILALCRNINEFYATENL